MTTLHRHVDTHRIRELVRELLIALGEDPDREGLVKTPQRVADALAFLTSGSRTDFEKIINGGYDRAYDLLNRNREAVTLIAEALLDQEALDADELKTLLARSGARA